MVSALSPIETKLGDTYKGAPKLSAKARKMVVEWMPWVALVIGLLSLWAAWGVWQLATVVNTVATYTNALSSYYGTVPMATNQWTLGLWLGLLTLAAEGVLYLLAFPALRAHRKMGWDLLFYGVLVNIVYAVVSIFAFPGDGLMRLVGALIGSAIGFYFLYQIRDSYTAK